jgi:hypothetical protein
MHSRIHFAAVVAALASSVALLGCDASAPASTTADLGVEVEALVGSDAYAPGSTYLVNGRVTTFDHARLYLSNLRLVRGDGSEVLITAESPITVPAYDAGGATISHTVSESVVYAPLDLGHFDGDLGEVPEGNYAGVRFDVGLVGTTNRVDATQVPAGHPLSVRTDVGNWWSWNAGYIFSLIEGRVDADGDGSVTGATDADWNVHLGTSGFVVPVELNDSFTIEGGTSPALHIQVDLAHLLENVDLGDPAQRVCHTMNNIPVATAVGGSLSHAFHFHGLHAD